MESIECLRSREHLFMQQSRLNPEVEFILARWAEYSKRHRRARVDNLRDFLNWHLATQRIVTAEAHRRALERQRADLAGDRRMLALVGEHEKRQIDITFMSGARHSIVGSGVLRPRVLPVWATEGQYLTVILARPACRGCGCTSERPCEGGCFLVTPDGCSRCVRMRHERALRRA